MGRKMWEMASCRLSLTAHMRGSLVGAGRPAAHAGGRSRQAGPPGATVISGNRAVTQHICPRLPQKRWEPLGRRGIRRPSPGPIHHLILSHPQLRGAAGAGVERLSPAPFLEVCERSNLKAPLETAEIHPAPFHFLITNTPQNLSQAALMRPHVFPPSRFTGSYS